MKFFLANIFSVVCAVGAVVVICLGKDGWGWLLFVGLLGFVTLNEK